MTEERFPYELVSHWRVPGRIDDVYAVLTDGPSLPRWWPTAHKRVTEAARGDASGVGRVLDIVTRGALPYDLVWRLEILEAEKPTHIRLRASGELTGFGEWRLRQDGGDVALTYDWRVRAGKPWMQRLEFLLKPLFRLNHRYVMRMGEEGLKRELAERAAAQPYLHPTSTGPEQDGDPGVVRWSKGATVPVPPRERGRAFPLGEAKPSLEEKGGGHSDLSGTR